MGSLRSMLAGLGPRLPTKGVEFAAEGLLDGLDGGAREDGGRRGDWSSSPAG
jgi:hypothetical protein